MNCGPIDTAEQIIRKMHGLSLCNKYSMKNIVQEHLLNGHDLQSLKEKFAIDAKRHGQFPNLVLFKYNQIESPMGEKVVQHARGVILDESDNWKVVSWPFNKFFNYGEGHADSIDWSTAKVQEKLDGSLTTLYFYQGEWRVASSGMPDAAGNISSVELMSSGGRWNPRPGMEINIPGSFAEYFHQILALYPDLQSQVLERTLNSEYCFMFEMMGLLNKVVVPHYQARLVLLGARHLTTGMELTGREANGTLLRNAAEVVTEFPLTSMDGIVSTFTSMSPLQQEGYVVVDDEFHRIKVKHPGYVALHHAKDGMNPKSFLEIIRSGESEEVLVAFPEFKPMMDALTLKYRELESVLEADYQRLKDIPIQKDFALEALKTKCSGALFSLRAKKVVSIRQFLQEMRVDNLMNLLGENNVDK